MEVAIKTEGSRTFVEIVGSLDLYNVGGVKKKLQPLLEDEVTSYLILDLENLEYVDSSGIALMAHIRKKVMAKKGKLVLLKTRDSVLQVMRLAALDQFFTFISSSEDL